MAKPPVVATSPVVTLQTATQKAVAEMAKLVAGLETVSTTLLGQTSGLLLLEENVLIKQAELQNLNAQFDTEYRTGAAELKLRVLENKQDVFNSLASELGYAVIANEDLQAVENKCIEAIESKEAAIEAAVREAVNKVHASKGAELSAVKAEFAVKEATAKAELTSKDNEIQLLKVQLAKAEETITAERNARVETAKADSQRAAPTVTVGK